MGTHQHRVGDNDSYPGDRREPRGPFDVVRVRQGSVAAHVGELRDLTRISISLETALLEAFDRYVARLFEGEVLVDRNPVIMRG